MELENRLLEVPYDDLLRSIRFHSRSKDLALDFQGSEANGAAWSGRDFLITIRAVDSATTRLVVQSVGGVEVPFGVRSWVRLRDKLQKDGIQLGRSKAQKISDLLVAQGIQERNASQPIDASAENAYKSRVRTEKPNLGEDDLQDLWGRHVSDVKRAREELRRREQSARDAVDDAVSVFFSSLSGDPPVTPVPDDPQTGSLGGVPSKPLVLQQWKQIWRLIRSQVEYGHTYEFLATWLRKMHPEIARGPDTLRKVVKAGKAGLLDERR